MKLDLNLLPQKEGKEISSVEAGSVFCELAILYNCKRTATIEASTDVYAWELAQNVYHTLMMQHEKSRRQELFKVGCSSSSRMVTLRRTE